MRLWARGQLHDPRHQPASSDDTLDDAAAALGLEIEWPEDDDSAPEQTGPALPTFPLWPCNVPMYTLWGKLQTQWMVGMHGRDGLNYDSVLRYLREVAHIRPRRLPEVMECIQAMERAALEEWNIQRAEEQERLQATRK